MQPSLDNECRAVVCLQLNLYSCTVSTVGQLPSQTLYHGKRQREPARAGIALAAAGVRPMLTESQWIEAEPLPHSLLHAMVHINSLHCIAATIYSWPSGACMDLITVELLPSGVDHTVQCTAQACQSPCGGVDVHNLCVTNLQLVCTQHSATNVSLMSARQHHTVATLTTVRPVNVRLQRCSRMPNTAHAMHS